MSDDPPKDKDKLNVLDFSKPDEFKAVIELLQRELPNFIAMAPVLAKMRKANYDAAIEAGFTPDQALDLCWRQEIG